MTRLIYYAASVLGAWAAVAGGLLLLAMAPGNPPALDRPAAYDYEITVDQPLGYWRLNDAGPPVARDQREDHPGRIHQGVTPGAPGALGAVGGPAMLFDGVRGFVEMQGTRSLNLTGDLALEAWARPAALDGTSRAVVMKGNGGDLANWQYRLSLSAENHWRGSVYAGDRSYTVTDPDPALAGDWTHVVLVRYGGTLILYVNGRPAATAPGPETLNTSPGPLTIGRDGASAEHYFNGAIDEVALYAHALSAERVLVHYRAALAAASLDLATPGAPAAATAAPGVRPGPVGGP